MDKGIKFTRHALERMTERGASCEFIGAAVTGSVKAVGYPSPRNHDIRILTAKDGDGTYWTVIYSENRVITVRRAHTSEEKRYEEAFKQKGE